MTTPKVDDGGPAFPDPAPREDGKPGMSLRDWFAGQALAGLMVGTNMEKWSKGLEVPLHNAATRFCYKVADVMIEQRKS